ncbi:MAG: ATP-binding protein [Romboutsia timonensis]
MYDVTEFHFNKNECWFKHKCPYYGDKEECHCACPNYCKFYHLVGLANLPKYMTYPENQILEPGEDANEYAYLESIKENIVEWVQQGNNLLLYSAVCGNGKTTWAIKLMCKYFSRIMFSNDLYTCRGLYINVDEFLFDYKRNMKKQDDRFECIVDLLPTVDLVIWDDIGNTALSEFDHSLLYGMINKRIATGKANIFTSNRIDNDMIKNIGYRLGNRIIETSDIIEFINPTKRQPKSRRK